MTSSAFAPGKWLLLLLALLLAAGGLPLRAAEIEPAPARVSAAYRDAEQFYRISEFFTGRENTGRDVIRRSQPEERAGYYFTARLPRYRYPEEVAEAIRLEVILPGDVEPTLFTFPLGPQRRRNPLILVGLTGEDWPDPHRLPLAWRISFADAEGTIFAQAKSFLWGQ